MKYLQKEQKGTVLSKALSRSKPAVFQEMKDGCSKDTKGHGGKGSGRHTKHGFAGHRQDLGFYSNCNGKPLIGKVVT